MARWTDIAEWVGPTPNRYIDGQVESRGLVLHIMEGTYAGSIQWGKNPVSKVSFHFATRSDGHIGQLVDTADGAWTQGSGNGHWISVENEGFSGNPLTPGQVEACARVYARGVREYGWPLQTTDSTTGYGLGWHGMGGAAWGSHLDCPGEPIKAQRAAILAAAEQILNGGEDMTPEEHDLLVQANLYAYNASAVAFALAAGADQATCKVTWGAELGQDFQQSLAPYWARVKAGGVDGDVSSDAATIIAAVRGEGEATRSEVRDAVADLGEGGAAQVRADA